MQLGPQYLPLKIESDIEQIVFTPNITLRRLPEEEALNLFNLKSRSFHSDGRVHGYGYRTPRSVDPIPEQLKYSQIYSSNYVFVDNEGRNLHSQSLDSLVRLSSLGCSGLMIGYQKGSSIICWPSPYWTGLPFTKINQSEEGRLKQVFLRLSNLSPKAQMMLERYKFALSFDSIPDQNRFIDLTTIMEMIYIPEKSGTELSFRLSLRLAKVMNQKFGLNSKEAYKEAKKLYGIRSSLVHTGVSKALNHEMLFKLLDFTHKSLALFIDEPSLFEEESLNELCL